MYIHIGCLRKSSFGTLIREYGILPILGRYLSPCLTRFCRPTQLEKQESYRSELTCVHRTERIALRLQTQQHIHHNLEKPSPLVAKHVL